MLQTLVVVTFWIIVFFIACAISPVVFFLMIIWTIYQIITKRFAESTKCYHRTLQQELIKTIVEIIRMVGSKDYGTDLRNQASHELCKRIVDSGVLDEAHLPFI